MDHQDRQEVLDHQVQVARRDLQEVLDHLDPLEVRVQVDPLDLREALDRVEAPEVPVQVDHPDQRVRQEFLVQAVPPELGEAQAHLERLEFQ